MKTRTYQGKDRMILEVTGTYKGKAFRKTFSANWDPRGFEIEEYDGVPYLMYTVNGERRGQAL